MENKAKPKPQPKNQLDEECGMTRKEALDTVLAIVADGKKRIRQGNCFTPDESYERIRVKREELINKGYK